MQSVATWLLGSARFVPHGFCLLWRPDLVAIHVVSDALIALAYFAIPLAIYSFVRQRGDLQPGHKRTAMLFVAFIMWCGLTHVAAIVTLWQPYYGLQALAKAITATVSVVTASALPFVIPKLLQIPSPEAMAMANARLQAEVGAHQATLRQLKSAREDLERRVADQTEDLRVANARFRAALANSQVTLFEQTAEGRFTWVHNPGSGRPISELIGRTETELFSGEAAAGMASLRQAALEAGEGRRDELAVVHQQGQRWYDFKVEPAQLRDGSPGVLGVATDVTAQKQQQLHLETISRELNHRAKNVLAIVQSIARQTAKGRDVPEGFLSALNERLRALAATHDVLVKENWSGADLSAVAQGQLQHQLAIFPDRIEITGPPVALAPETAHYVGMALHELGANAAKYGALSNEEGRVRLSWTVAQEPEGRQRLGVQWVEEGGPDMPAATRQGFGRTILEALTPRALGGSADLSFAPEGVRWRLDAVLGPVRSSPDAAPPG